MQHSYERRYSLQWKMAKQLHMLSFCEVCTQNRLIKKKSKANHCIHLTMLSACLSLEFGRPMWPNSSFHQVSITHQLYTLLQSFVSFLHVNVILIHAWCSGEVAGTGLMHLSFLALLLTSQGWTRWIRTIREAEQPPYWSPCVRCCAKFFTFFLK